MGLGHAFSARWHLGPVSGHYFWWVLVTSPEVLVFLFFMITDPKTTPRSTRGRALYAVSIGLLSVLLIAPAKTEFWAKVALLGALAIVCAARPLLALDAPAPPRPARPRRARRRRTRRLHGRDRRGRDPRTARDHRGAARTHGAASPGDDPAVAPGPDGAQAEDGTPDCSRPRRRPPDADRGPDRATTRRARPRLDRRRTERADSPDRRGKGRADRGAGVSGRSNARPSRTRSRPGRGDRGSQAGRIDAACELYGLHGPPWSGARRPHRCTRHSSCRRE